MLQKIKKREIIEKIGIGILILIITILAFKFLAWNFWKLEQSVRMTKHLLKTPPAINLTISKNGMRLFQKSFAYNRSGNFYIINQFDVTPFINDNSFLLSINESKITEFVLYRFTYFNLLHFEGYFFIFTKENCSIERFVELIDSMPLIVNSIFKLVIGEEKGKKKIIYTLLRDQEKELKYGKGRYSKTIPRTFKKNNLYEIVFDYKATDHVIPVVMVRNQPFELEKVLIKISLDITVQDIYRRGSIIFRPKTDLVSPRLHLMIRGRKLIKGKVYFKNVSFCQYQQEYQQLGQLTSPKITCFDFINKIKSDFIGTKGFK